MNTALRHMNTILEHMRGEIELAARTASITRRIADAHPEDTLASLKANSQQRIIDNASYKLNRLRAATEQMHEHQAAHIAAYVSDLRKQGYRYQNLRGKHLASSELAMHCRVEGMPTRFAMVNHSGHGAYIITWTNRMIDGSYHNHIGTQYVSIS